MFLVISKFVVTLYLIIYRQLYNPFLSFDIESRLK
ncbi:hypothetical protein HNR34_003757 [Geobacillus subterraneus]